MRFNRRRLFWSVLVGGGAAQAQSPGSSIEALRYVSLAHGQSLSDERLQILLPVFGTRRTQLQSVREFEIADSVEPTYG